MCNKAFLQAAGRLESWMNFWEAHLGNGLDGLLVLQHERSALSKHSQVHQLVKLSAIQV